MSARRCRHDSVIPTVSSQECHGGQGQGSRSISLPRRRKVRQHSLASRYLGSNPVLLVSDSWLKTTVPLRFLPHLPNSAPFLPPRRPITSKQLRKVSCFVCKTSVSTSVIINEKKEKKIRGIIRLDDALGTRWCGRSVTGLVILGPRFDSKRGANCCSVLLSLEVNMILRIC